MLVLENCRETRQTAREGKEGEQPSVHLASHWKGVMIFSQVFSGHRKTPRFDSQTRPTATETVLPTNAEMRHQGEREYRRG